MNYRKRLAKHESSSSFKAPKGTQVIDVAWLGATVLVVFNDKQRIKLAKKLGVDLNDQLAQPDCGCDGMAAVVYASTGVPYFIMYLPIDSARIVVHECTHMVHMLFDVHGIPLKRNNTETIAYMTDYLCGVVFRMFQDRRGDK